jgi:hypothetical protein
MAKPNFIELPDCKPIPILYEDHTIMVVVGYVAATFGCWF